MDQQTLFHDIPKEPPHEAARERAIEAAERQAAAAFKRSYYRFLIEYAERHDEWIAEDVQMAYRKTPLPQPTEWRATGAIIRKLVREGLIEATGNYRNSEIRKSPMMIYRWMGRQEI